MDATVLLQIDHDRIKTLVRTLTDGGGAASRADAFRSLRSELNAHARIEEEVFYPAVMKVRSQAVREAVRAALEAHHVVDGLLAELGQCDAEEPRFRAAAAGLRTALERHIAEEEGPMFAEARIHLTDERLERLGRRMESLKAAL